MMIAGRFVFPGVHLRHGFISDTGSSQKRVHLRHFPGVHARRRVEAGHLLQVSHLLQVGNARERRAPHIHPNRQPLLRISFTPTASLCLGFHSPQPPASAENFIPHNRQPLLRISRVRRRWFPA